MDDLLGGDAGVGGCFGADGPEGGDPVCAGEFVPLLGEIDVEEAFAGALVACLTVFEGEQRGIADEERGVGGIEHGIEVGTVRLEGGSGFPEAMKEDAGVGGGGSGRGVESDAADGLHVAVFADDEEDGTDALARGDGAAGDDKHAGLRGVGGDGHEADVGFSGGELGGADGRGGPGELVAVGEFLLRGWMFEVPHERGGIEEGDGGNAELHASVYQRKSK